MNSTSKEFLFEPDRIYYYSDTYLAWSFTVQVALSKPNRRRALASQFIIVVYPENPVTLRCSFNCGTLMNTEMEMVLNTTCSRSSVCTDAANTLTYRWELVPLCPQNFVKELRWLTDTLTSVNQSSLHLKPNVFNNSVGYEPYLIRLTGRWSEQ